MTDQSNAFWTLAFAAVGAAGSAIAAVTGVLLWWSSALKRREEKRRDAQTEADRWSMVLSQQKAAIYLVELFYDLTAAPDIALRRYRIIAPTAARFCAYQWERKGDANSPAELVIGAERFRAVASSERSIRGGFKSHRISVYVEMPSRPRWSASSTTRLQIEVRFEERSASRRQRTITVTSEEIPWSAKHAASAT